MNTRRLLVALSVVLVSCAATAQGALGDEALRTWVANEGAFYLERYAAGEVQPILDRMADDFLYRDLSGNVAEGPDAYGELIRGYLAAGASLTAEGPHRYGHLADDLTYSIWTWTFTGEGDAVLARGESLYLYRATPDGDWEWAMQYSAPFLPAPQAGAGQP